MKTKYPSIYFLNRLAMRKANDSGLTDVENEDLSNEGIYAKMREWQENEGGVSAHIYDITEKELQRRGDVMPKEILRL